MLLPNDIQNDYKSLSELGRGTLKEIMKALKLKNSSHASNIMNGKAATTITNVGKIKKLIEAKKTLATELSQNDQN